VVSKPARSVPDAPAAGKASTPGTASSGRYARAKATAPAAGGGGAETEVGGVRWAADGSLADPAQWTPEIAEAIAAASGVSLTEEHQRLIRFAREEWTRTGQSPNIRRMTTGAQITTKEIYTLFPKAPGRTISRIAGIPKPAGCI
jgi:tRNA 2-thiouridine synthesizing protein E